MAQTLDPILPDTAISDRRGRITDFFRLRWAKLIQLIGLAPTVGGINGTGLVANLVTTNIFVTKAAGLYRASWYLRKTRADGVTSRLVATIGYTESGLPLTFVGANLDTDTAAAVQSEARVFQCDQSVAITGAIAYTSNTPGNMIGEYWFVVEQLAP